MVDAIVSVVLEQLISMAVEEAKQQVRLVTGVGIEVKRLQDNFEAIQAVVVDAEQRQVKEAPVRLWLENLTDVSYDMEDVLDEWITAMKIDENAVVPHKKKVCSFLPATSCFGYIRPKQSFKQIFLRRNIALNIKAIDEKLVDIARQKDMFHFNVIRCTEKSERVQSTALINVSEVRGRDEEKETLKSKLLSESSEQQNAVQIISLIGMGGIGKTTLAQFAYNDEDVKNSFDKRMWVCVSDPFDEFRIAKAIIEALEGSATNLGELNSLLLHIHTSIERKKFLLVLDDVWTEDRNKWEPFHNCLMNGLRGSKILVTTRKETVAQMMESIDVVSVKEMSEPESISLFERFAFFGRSPSDCEQLKDIGRGIVFKCKGLPLAVKTIGSLLRFKTRREEWQSILESEMWQLEEFESGLLPPLLLSYNDLPSVIKRCFSYCAVFPKDHNIEKDELIKLWMAQGYIRPKENKELEMIGEEYFDYLATRSFFQEFEKDSMGNVLACKMHDIIHDFSQFLTKIECVSIEVDDPEESLSLINSFGEKLRHSMLVLGDNATFPISIRNARKLRSILIYIPFDVLSVDLHVLLNQFTCLRTLKITGRYSMYGYSVPEIPKEIENLMHLRFLKLDNVGIEDLPEIYCELFNLQTLDIERCEEMRSLPEGIGKLINLRHLLFCGCRVEYMPKGFERLTCLRTLSEFVVGSWSKYGGKSCNLEGLRHMNHLRGFLKIRGLENVVNVDEAKNAHIEKKKNLVDLELQFGTHFSSEEEASDEENEANHEAISEALRPPPNLESLEISYYKGKTVWPSWIVTLNKLKKLNLFRVGCEIMPPLGKLPSLEILRIAHNKSVKKMGDEFWGLEYHATSSSSSANYVAFPKLKELSLEDWDEWEEWDVGKEDIIILPQLNSLDLHSCRKLKSLPDKLLRSTTLEELSIYNYPILEERFRKDTGEDWSKICHIPNMQN